MWFGYLDTLLDDDAISRTLFTFNHHALSHLPHLIKVLRSIRAVSARGLERKIGVVKRVVRSTNKAGVNAGNELDQEDVFTFLEFAGAIDFLEPFQRKTRDIADTFRYHPAAHPSLPDFEEKKKLPQQWVPFLPSVLLSELLSSPAEVIQNTKVTFKELTTAMLTYLIRLTGNSAAAFSDFHKNQTVEFSERLWCDSIVYSTEAYKDKKANATRKDCYCFLNPKREGV